MFRQRASPSARLHIRHRDRNTSTRQVRAADDFYTHVNGKWLADDRRFPTDKASWGPVVRPAPGIAGTSSAHSSRPPRLRRAGSAEARKVGDLYRSFMDEARLETLEDEAARRRIRGDRPHQGQGRAAGADRPPAADRRHSRRSTSTSTRTSAIRPPTSSTCRKPASAFPIATTTSTTTMRASSTSARNTASTSRAMLSMAGSKTAKQDATDILALETAIARTTGPRCEIARSGENVPQDHASRTCRPLRPDSTGTPTSMRPACRQRSPTSCCTRQLSQGFRRALREDAAAGVEGLPQVGRCCAITDASSTRPSSTSGSPSTARRSTAFRRFARAGSAACELVDELDRRGARPRLRREIFPAGEQGADGKAGRQPARHLQAEHRRPRLDGTADEEGGAGQARQDRDRRSAIRRSGATTRSSSSSPTTSSAT